MKTNSAPNKSDLEITPSSAPPSWPSDAAEFLELKAQIDKDAMMGTARAMLGDLRQSVDVAAWVRRFPWPSTISAAAAGVFLGVQVTRDRPKPQQEDIQNQSGSHSEEKSSLLAWVASIGIGMLKDILVPVIQQRIQSARKHSDPPR